MIKVANGIIGFVPVKDLLNSISKPSSDISDSKKINSKVDGTYTSLVQSHIGLCETSQCE